MPERFSNTSYRHFSFLPPFVPRLPTNSLSPASRLTYHHLNSTIRRTCPNYRYNMEGAFTHVGNHLISDSAAAIKAGADDLSALDPDEALLYGKYGGQSGRRRADDDDNQTEAFEEDDNDSLNSVPIDQMMGMKLKNPEEEKELPPHACA